VLPAYVRVYRCSVQLTRKQESLFWVITFREDKNSRVSHLAWSDCGLCRAIFCKESVYCTIMIRSFISNTTWLLIGIEHFLSIVVTCWKDQRSSLQDMVLGVYYLFSSTLVWAMNFDVKWMRPVYQTPVHFSNYSSARCVSHSFLKPSFWVGLKSQIRV